MRGFSYVIKGFYIVTAGLCLLFFVAALYDFVLYRKTKKADGMLLQLPLGLKTRIHKIMGFFLRDKRKSTFRLILAALAVGFGVSLVEAVCTGQVYVPTCVLIMQNPTFRCRFIPMMSTPKKMKMGSWASRKCGMCWMPRLIAIWFMV